MGKVRHARSAQKRGEVRKRRRKRAERREKTRPIREAINAKRRAEGHPGWVESYTWPPRDWPEHWAW
jgi:hypothetical protein